MPGDVTAYVGSGLLLCDQERMEKAGDEVAARVEALLKARAPGLAGSLERRRYEAEWADAVDEAAETLPEDSCGVKSRAAFREQMDTYLRLSAATNQRLDVREVIKSVGGELLHRRGVRPQAPGAGREAGAVPGRTGGAQEEVRRPRFARTSSLIRWMWPRPRALTSQPSSK